MPVNRRRSSRIAVALATIAALALVPTIVSAHTTDGTTGGSVGRNAAATNGSVHVWPNQITPILSWATPA